MTIRTVLRNIWDWEYKPAVVPAGVPVLTLHVPVPPEVADQYREKPVEVEVVVVPKKPVVKKKAKAKAPVAKKGKRS